MLNIDELKKTKIRCAGLGEILYDILPTGSKLGGAPINFTYHCKCQGLEAIAISAIGNDELGKNAILSLGKMFIPTYMPIVDKPTGAVLVRLDAQGCAQYEFVKNCAYEHIPFNEDLKYLASKINVLCFGTLCQIGDISKNTIAQFIEKMPSNSIKFYDMNLRDGMYNDTIIAHSLKLCNIVKCNEHEAPYLCKMLNIKEDYDLLYKKLYEQNIYGLIITLGENGSYVYLNNQKSYTKSPKVQVIDTIGAGDSFSAAFISNILKGHPLNDAHQRACEIAAFVCTKQGAMPEYE